MAEENYWKIDIPDYERYRFYTIQFPKVQSLVLRVRDHGSCKTRVKRPRVVWPVPKWHRVPKAPRTGRQGLKRTLHV